MAVDPRKRQKKLERQRAKKKAQQRQFAQRASLGVAERVRGAARFPILHCLVSTEIWEVGIGHVLISRELPNGNVACAEMLVDVYCLGVKDATARILPRAVYQSKIYERLIEGLSCRRVSPEYARKLIEGAVDYADHCGLAPHPDYDKARPIFGDIDASACAESFVYGHEGKPTFMNGPYDEPARCRDIIRRLRERFGEDGFTFIVHARSDDTMQNLAEAILGPGTLYALDPPDDEDAGDVEDENEAPEFHGWKRASGLSTLR